MFAISKSAGAPLAGSLLFRRATFAIGGNVSSLCHQSVMAAPSIVPNVNQHSTFSPKEAFQKRTFSFFPPKNNQSFNSSSKQLVGPSYQIYGEESALTVRAIPPEFRQLPNGGRIVLNGQNSRGRLLLQFTARAVGGDGKYQWDSSIRFALSAEEAASLFLARLDPQRLLFVPPPPQNHENNTTTAPVAVAEVLRRANPQNNDFHNNNHNHNHDHSNNDSMPDKVLRGHLNADGSVTLMVDYERDGMGGQEPPSMNETRGPLKIDLMVGEYHVLRSIVEYSLPRLIGWSAKMEASLEQSIDKAVSQQQPGNSYNESPHNYQGNNQGGGVPF